MSNDPVMVIRVPGDPVLDESERLVVADTGDKGSSAKNSNNAINMPEKTLNICLALVYIHPLIQTQMSL